MSPESESAVSNESIFRSVYDDTTYFIDSIIQGYDAFPTILDRMRSGDASVELRKRFFLRAIDETWVNIIEDTLPALDIIIRNPSKFIEEKEVLMSAEQTKSISQRSIQYLSQHTNLIQRIDGDMIIPSKLLNVFREETIQTYENKFVNTLINRLYTFVNRRYEIARRAGQDEKTTNLTFNDKFDHDGVKVKMNFSLEISEPSSGKDDKVERNYSYTTSLWKRVERLNSIVTNYANSDFVQQMGHSFIRPPVMKTNAILKNKNLHQCLTLWQFIESYDSAGYSMLVQEDLENVDDEYIKELYSTLALQYMIFRYNIRNDFEIENTLASELTADELRPRIVDELEHLKSDEFNLKDTMPERVAASPLEARTAVLTPEDQLHLQSIDIALEAAEIIRSNGDEIIYDGGNIREPEPVPDAVLRTQPEQAAAAAEEDRSAEDGTGEAADTEENAAEEAAESAEAAEATAEEAAESAKNAEDAAEETAADAAGIIEEGAPEDAGMPESENADAPEAVPDLTPPAVQDSQPGGSEAAAASCEKEVVSARGYRRYAYRSRRNAGTQSKKQ